MATTHRLDDGRRPSTPRLRTALGMQQLGADPSTTLQKAPRVELG